jgi:AsmA-like C-terminal region
VISRRRLWIFVAACLGILTVGAITLALRIPFTSETLRKRVVQTLSDRLDAEVELSDLTLRVLPALHADGTGLRVRHKGRRDVPPLISIAKFTVDADLLGLWRNHVAHVRLDGLDIQIPPADHDPDGDHNGDARVEDGDPDGDDGDSPERDIVIDELVADNATLTILPREVGKRPKVWHLHELHLQSVGAFNKMPFRTVMTNAMPPGRITTSGAFGPWKTVAPGLTPVDGTFTFENADLGVFKGISGILTTRGSYSGTLERIDVTGETDTPNFMVNVSGHTVPLKTKYHAIVDATNGDTTLERIDATFLKTSLVAKGGVYGVEGARGRLVTLDIDMPSGRLEDIMRLAVKTSQPPMTGRLRLRTTFDLPPGDADIVDKLKLDGAFTIDDGRFTNAEVQQKINRLSRRASAKASEDATQTAAADFSGRFGLADGQLALSTLTFNVPGAIIEISGQYSLAREVLAFNGSLFMDAKVSQTTTGWKSLMLNAVDPLFRKDGRTVIPIKITGTRSEPSFSMDVRRVFRRGDSEP